MKYLILFISSALFSAPLTINFQMVLKDSLGRPTPLSGARITFQLAGETGISFWSETKTFTTPNGVITTKLGDAVAIDPVSFYAQSMVRVSVIRESSGDTILSEPFNAIPFAFKANFSDSSGNATLFQGKTPSDFLASTFEGDIRKSISDSIAAHPTQDPAPRISDTAASLRVYAVTQDNSIKAALRGEIRDSINAHPGIDPTAEISDTASGVRLYAVSQDSGLKASLREEIGDSIASHPGLDPTAEISDTAANVRTYAVVQDNGMISTIRGEIGDSIAAHPIIDPSNEISDSASSVRTFNKNYADSLKSNLYDILVSTISSENVNIVDLKNNSGEIIIGLPFVNAFSKIYYNYNTGMLTNCMIIKESYVDPDSVLDIRPFNDQVPDRSHKLTITFLQEAKLRVSYYTGGSITGFPGQIIYVRN